MRRILLTNICINCLGWYDFSLYAIFSSIFSKLFFPTSDHYTALIATFSVFAAGFAMRPIGAIFFGLIGDRFGRRASVGSAILLMSLTTPMIGFIPDYASIGVAAPITLILLRFAQCFALGGAFSGSIAFLVEHAPPQKRAIFGSTAMLSMVVGILLGTTVSTLIAYILDEAAYEMWGWRIAFFLGAFSLVAALYMRFKLPESPIYLEAKAANALSANPFTELLRNHTGLFLVVIGIVLLLTIPFYTLTGFMITLLQMVGFSKKLALLMNSISLIALSITIPFSAIISDRTGRKIPMLIAALLFALFSYPIMKMVCITDFTISLTWQILFAVIAGLYIGPLAALLVELFPTRIRYTGMSFTYNFAIAIFGGTTPLIATSLIRLYEQSPFFLEAINKHVLGISAYLCIGAIISFVCLLLARINKQLS